MATPQTHRPTIGIEKLLEKANAESFEEKHDVIDSAPLPSELSQLDTLAEPLRSLCKRIVDARWGEVASMTQVQIAEAVKLRLAHGGLTIPQIDKALPLIKEWCDRVEGKSVERVDTRSVVIHAQADRRRAAEVEAEEMLALLAARSRSSE